MGCSFYLRRVAIGMGATLCPTTYIHPWTDTLHKLAKLKSWYRPWFLGIMVSQRSEQRCASMATNDIIAGNSAAMRTRHVCFGTPVCTLTQASGLPRTGLVVSMSYNLHSMPSLVPMPVNQQLYLSRRTVFHSQSAHRSD